MLHSNFSEILPSFYYSSYGLSYMHANAFNTYLQKCFRTEANTVMSWQLGWCLRFMSRRTFPIHAVELFSFHYTSKYVKYQRKSTVLGFKVGKWIILSSGLTSHFVTDREELSLKDCICLGWCVAKNCVPIYDT